MEDRNAETLPMVASQKMKHGRVCDIVSDVVRRTSESVAIPLVRFSDRSLSKAIAATRVLTLAFNVALLRIKKDQTHEFVGQPAAPLTSEGQLTNRRHKHIRRFNGGRLLRSISGIRRQTTDGPHHIHTGIISRPTERGVLIVQMSVSSQTNEKLRACRIRIA